MPEPISEDELERIVDEVIAEVGATSLRDIGRAAATQWLDASYDKIGVESTLDTRMAFS